MPDPKPKKNDAPTYRPEPSVLPGFPKAKHAKSKSGMGGGKKRKRWIDPDTGDILEWDYQHGKVERYNDRGKHLGEYDPDTGIQTKPAKPGRTISPNIWKLRKKVKLVYYLRWYEKDGDGYVGESLLAGVSEGDVRVTFGLEQDEPPGNCIEVGTEHAAWLGEAAKSVTVRPDLFAYFVEASQG
jgi:Cytotoxic